MNSISTYDLGKLEDCFRTKVPRPVWRPWLGNVDRAIEKVEDDLDSLSVAYAGVKISTVREVFRQISVSGRYSYAVWRWLRPKPPVPDASDLVAIRELSGLNHVPLETFAARLAERCVEIGRECSELRRWVDRRIALAEYVSRKPTKMAGELKGSPMRLRLALFRAAQWLGVDPEAATSIAAPVLQAAMDAAAHTVRDTFGAEDCTIDANLMVPLVNSVRFAPNETATANADAASRLWGDVRADARRLAIVAETRGSTHLGFWIPVLRGERGSMLPGAPTAFTHRAGSAVFKDDLPPLNGFGEKLEARWRTFMVSDFHHDLFVSLPLRVPSGAGLVTAAVLNVNVSAADLRPWRRAYHSEWLCIARDNVGPLIEIAYAALLIMNAEKGRLLDTGAPEWDRLPTVASRRLYGGHS